MVSIYEDTTRYAIINGGCVMKEENDGKPQTICRWIIKNHYQILSTIYFPLIKTVSESRVAVTKRLSVRIVDIESSCSLPRSEVNTTAAVLH